MEKYHWSTQDCMTLTAPTSGLFRRYAGPHVATAQQVGHDHLHGGGEAALRAGAGWDARARRCSPRAHLAAAAAAVNVFGGCAPLLTPVRGAADLAAR
ncbi:MAG: hypothetical protein ACLUEK_00230 [Oscillospiraceae bacterium]